MRSFCFGWFGVALPLHLAFLGLDERGLGIAASLTLLAAAVSNLATHGPARRWGAPPVLVALSALSAASGALFLATSHPWAAVLAAMLGGVAMGAENGAFLTMEVVLLSRSSRHHSLTKNLSFYNLAGYASAAVGALAASRAAARPQWAFWAFGLCSILQALAYAMLIRRPRHGTEAPLEPRPKIADKDRGGALVKRLAALNALDAFAGGFLVQGLLVYWFHARFGLGARDLGTLFALIQAATGLSFLLATPLAARFGLVPTMVFAHFASNILLISVAFAPTAQTAAALLLARHLLSQIDVPTRHAFLMLAVEDHAREAAASLTGSSRAFAQCLSPIATGWMMRAGSLATPFILCGGLKILYDVLLYAVAFRVQIHERPPTIDAAVAADDNPG